MAPYFVLCRPFRVQPSYYPYYYPLSRVTTLIPQIAPAGCRPLPLACSLACRFQIGQQGPNPLPPHTGAGLFDVRKTERANLFASTD